MVGIDNNYAWFVIANQLNSTQCKQKAREAAIISPQSLTNDLEKAPLIIS